MISTKGEKILAFYLYGSAGSPAVQPSGPLAELYCIASGFCI